MIVSNLKSVQAWLDAVRDDGFVFYRFRSYDIGKLDMEWETELEKHAALYLQCPRHHTFHHIRLLMKDLLTGEIKHPLVGTVRNDQIQINPGGSRLMVAKYLGKRTTPLDLIMHKRFIPKFAVGDFSEVKDSEVMFGPFAECPFTVSVDLHHGDYRYENNMPQFHWSKDDMDSWLDKNASERCSNLLDYYRL